MSRVSKDKTSWRGSGLAKKYGQVTENIVSKARIFSRKKWCKGRKGIPHNFVVTTISTVGIYSEPETWTEKVCKKCGRKEIDMRPAPKPTNGKTRVNE